MEQGKTVYRLQTEDSYDGVPIKFETINKEEITDTPLMGEMIAASHDFHEANGIVPHLTLLFAER